MAEMNCLELEQEIGKMAAAMMTRNSQIGEDLIANLKTQMTLEDVAGVMLVSIERLMWFDTESVIWTIKHLIPSDVMQEIRRITSVAVCKQLIGKGFILGKDFSVSATGKLLLNQNAKTAILPLATIE
jgi:hypothetical protein